MGQVRKANDILTLSLHRDSNKIITDVAVLLPFLFTPCAVLPWFLFCSIKSSCPSSQPSTDCNGCLGLWVTREAGYPERLLLH